MADPPPDRATARLDALVALGVAALVLAAVLISSLASGGGHPPVTAMAPAADPSCAEWTDGCRVCQRLPDGPACSLPGIACTLGQQECLRHGTAQ